jgi:hypothetical protein
MTQQENVRATPDEKVVHRAKAWRDRDKEATANRCDDTKRAEYFARQQLREAVDMLEKKGSADQQ